jgi:hypothetical protein
MGAGKNRESLSIYFLYSEILVIFYCVSSEFSQIHTGEAGTLRNVQFYTKCVILKPETLSKLILNNSEICNSKSILNIKKSTCPYSISTIVLKSLKSVLSKQLKIIFISTFTTGIVPNSL